jgi:hypothetical protein
LAVVNKESWRQQAPDVVAGIEDTAHQILNLADQLQAKANIPIQRCQIAIEQNRSLFDRSKLIVAYPAVSERRK